MTSVAKSHFYEAVKEIKSGKKSGRENPSPKHRVIAYGVVTVTTLDRTDLTVMVGKLAGGIVGSKGYFLVSPTVLVANTL